MVGRFVFIRVILFCFYFVFLSTSGYSQALIKGSVIDSLSNPVSYVSVVLVKATDSSLVKGQISDDGGNYFFEKMPPGTYFIKTFSPEHKESASAIFMFDSITSLIVPQLTLKKSEIKLDEVSVEAVKKTIEFKNGNIIVNIEGSPLAIGNSVYDLLSRLPGVSVVDNNISIQGTYGVKIYINEKLQQLSGDQLATLLKSMSAANVEKIEIMKNPPVKYDASGNAGIINIKTKIVKITGFSGNMNATYTQAYYANDLAGISLNYKGKKINLFGGFSWIDESVRKVNELNREVKFQSATSFLTQKHIEREHSKYIAANFGVDWFVNSNSSVGLKVSSTGGTTLNQRHGVINIANSDLNYDNSDFNFERNNPWNYSSINLNAEHSFDTLGTTIYFSVDYSPNYDFYNGVYNNYFKNIQSGNSLPSKILSSENRLTFNIYSGRIDFEKTLKSKIKIETGAKASNQDILSSFLFKNIDEISGTETIDTSLTNNFSYNEKLLAGYFNVIKKFKKINFQIGLRGENTLVKTSSRTSAFSLNRQYFNVFPVLSVDYAPSDKHVWQLSFNRRIDRPDYNSFNPFRIFRNYLVSDIGNPYLWPQYSYNANLTYGYNEYIYNTISYSYIDGYFFRYDVLNDSTKETVSNISNLTNRSDFTYSLYYQKNITKKWVFTLNGYFFYLAYKGTVLGNPYKGAGAAFSGSVNNQILLPKNFKIELNAFYIGGLLNGIEKNKGRFVAELSVKKTFANNKFVFAAGCSDIFFTNVVRSSVDFQNLKWNSKYSFDNRRIRISLIYNFGNFKIRQRDLKSNEEEEKRLKH
ncbi:MAG: outer membrane beta-barrel protein [Bacteroidia bacterium]|nr:outer membrane beta-barrel protein [Bacteroidia bacterium]